MIDKDTALGLIQLLRVATAEENVPYETRELKESALSALADVLRRAESEVNEHYEDNYRHRWYDTCKYCEVGILPDKRQSEKEQEAWEAERRRVTAAEYARLSASRRVLAAGDDDPENPFRG